MTISFTAISTSVINPVESVKKPLESAKEKASTDKSEEEIKLTIGDMKPWRKNMKKSDEKDPSM